MALIGNHSILNKSFQRTYGGSTLSAAFHMNNKSSLMSSAILRQRGQLQFKKAAIPSGYVAGSAFMPPRSAGELGAVRIDGQATITASGLSARIASLDAIFGQATVAGFANAIGLITLAGTSAGSATASAFTLVASSMSAALNAGASVAANLGAIIPIEAASAGIASMIANLKGRGRLGGDITIGGTGYLSNDDVERLAEAVWDEPTASHSTAGTTGKALIDAGSAGNPWSADLSSNNTPNTFGWFIQKLLKFVTFLGLK